MVRVYKNINEYFEKKLGRYLCTVEFPWDKSKQGNRVVHPDAKEVTQENGYPAGDVVTYKCPNCNSVFYSELPQ